MRYEAKFSSLDMRETPAWFDEAKLGIFIHWGIYSVPAYAPRKVNAIYQWLAYAEWYGMRILEENSDIANFHKRVYGKADYNSFASQWKAELFNPKEWAELFKYAGAKYVILTSKHHDAFCLWPSKYSQYWNSMDIGPHRDIVGELMAAVESVGIHKGLYYSLLEWFHPAMSTKNPDNAGVEVYAEQKMIPQLKELITQYKPKILFTDGAWGFHSSVWHSESFLAWLFNNSPVKDTIVVNDRWGKETPGRHGSYYSTEYMMKPDNLTQEEFDNIFDTYKWEECRGISDSFGFNRNEILNCYLTERDVIKLLVDTVARGGNLCLNVAPCADGTISPIIEERLRQLGDWMNVNSEAIYGTRPFKELPNGYMGTSKKDCFYFFIDKYDFKPIVLPRTIFPSNFTVTMLGCKKNPKVTVTDKSVEISPPQISLFEMPCREVFTFKVE